MKILLTGATGFIGSTLYKELMLREHLVTRLVRYVSGGRYDFYDMENRIFADLRDQSTTRRAVLDTAPDVIIHLAAQSAVSWSFKNPHEVTDVNLGGTQALADALVELGSGHFIMASTSEVYGAATEFPTSETSRLGATSPYAVSKMAAEEYLRVLSKTQGLPITIMRPFNTYGRALIGNRHFVVERAITQALTEHKIHLYDSRPMRDFLFRDDHVNGYLHVLDNLKNVVGEEINIATGGCWSIKEMAETVGHYVQLATRQTVEVDFSEVPDRPLDIMRLQGDNKKARELIKWIPAYSFSTGIQKAVEEWQTVLSV